MLRGKTIDLPGTGSGRIHVTEADVVFDQSNEPKTSPPPYRYLPCLSRYSALVNAAVIP